MKAARSTGICFPQLAMLVDEDLEVHAADELHHHEILPAHLAEMVGLDDVGVDEVGDEFGFADEVFDELLLVGVVLADDFNGEAFDEIAGAMLFGFVDDPHAALENFADDVVVKLVLNGEECHRLMVVKLELKSSGDSEGVKALNR